MRRFVFLAALVAIAACGAPLPEVGESSVKFASPPPADSALSRAAAELTRLGFTIGGRQENLVFTAPQPMPASARPANAVANDSTPQQWFLHVTADDRLFRGGSNTTVRAFLMPRTGNVSPGNVVQEQALLVTSDRPEAFRELRRIAEQLQAAAMRR